MESTESGISSQLACSKASSLGVAGVLFIIAACGCGTRPQSTEALRAPTGIGEPGELPPNTILLYDLTANATGLLGREVVSSKDHVEIADSVAPGCQVRIERDASVFSRHHRVALRELTTVSANYAFLARLNAQWGQSLAAEISVQNSEVLRAQVSGPCGAKVVKSVFVGTGQRTLNRKRVRNALGSAAISPVGALASNDADAIDDGSLAWTTNQAYAVEVGHPLTAAVDNLELHVVAPPIVHDGERLSIRVTSNRDAWLIVVYQEQNGMGEVLWPGTDLAEPKVAAQSPLTLPPADADALTASLRAGGDFNDEALVVYAFLDRRDWERARPEVLSDPYNRTPYTQRLEEFFRQLPIGRRERAVARYRILRKD